MDSMSYPFFTLVFLSPPHQKAIERLFFFLSVYREEDNSRQLFLLDELSFLFFFVIFVDLK